MPDWRQWVRVAIGRGLLLLKEAVDECEGAYRDAVSAEENAKPEPPWRAAPGRLRPEDIVPGRHVWQVGGFPSHGVVEADGRLRWLPHGVYWAAGFHKNLSLDEAGCFVTLYESEEAARKAPEIKRRPPRQGERGYK